MIGAVSLLGGCHGKRPSRDELLQRVKSVAHMQPPAPKPGELAERGRAAITAECDKQSYETAKKGLIVSETDLHEDVFALRDRVSYGEIAFSLDEALRLESLLQREVDVAGNPPEQTECIRQFAEHLEALSDPLVEEDERLKELDVSAFKDASKEATQTDKTAPQKPAENEAQPAAPVPH
jgi:hypothetical protein